MGQSRCYVSWLVREGIEKKEGTWIEIGRNMKRVLNEPKKDGGARNPDLTVHLSSCLFLPNQTNIIILILVRFFGAYTLP